MYREEKAHTSSLIQLDGILHVLVIFIKGMALALRNGLMDLLSHYELCLGTKVKRIMLLNNSRHHNDQGVSLSPGSMMHYIFNSLGI